jgi:hypothetical protein
MSKRNKILLTVAVSVLAIVLFVGTNWTKLYRYNTDVDLNSGKIRKDYYFWVFPIKQDVLETSFSKLLEHLDIPVSTEPDWHPDSKSMYILGLQKSGGYVQNACNHFVTAIQVAPIDDNKMKDYTKEALEHLKNKEFDKIQSLAENISKGTSGQS